MRGFRAEESIVRAEILASEIRRRSVRPVAKFQEPLFERNDKIVKRRVRDSRRPVMLSYSRLVIFHAHFERHLVVIPIIISLRLELSMEKSCGRKRLFFVQ